MDGTLLSCMIQGLSSLKDGSVKIVLETQEMSPAKIGELFTLRNQIAVVYISPKTISKREMDQVNAIDPEFKGKTPSQRLRAVLFLNWEHDNEGYKDFELFYRSKMESIITTYKSNLDPQ